jgi:bifunctional DNA-binding transcriptional regulator/antitoxin component of YhaV-PrlF toxin-antitoxin module
MTYTVSITSQGQISIPIQLRRKLGLDKIRIALVSEEKGQIVLEPIKDLLEIGGSLKTNKKPLSNTELNDIVATAVSEEYIRKLKRSR